MTSDDEIAHNTATSAGIGPSEETTEVPPPTTAAPELASSLDDGDAADQPGGRHS